MEKANNLLTKEYLPNLVDQKKWTMKCWNLETGDLFIILTECTTKSHQPQNNMQEFIQAPTDFCLTVIKN